MQDLGGYKTYAGKEPFDERLLLVRAWKNKWCLLGTMVVGTVILTALIMLGRYVQYLGSDSQVVQYYHFDYVVEPINTGDTSIIYQTWETYTTTQDFLEIEASYLREISQGKYDLDAAQLLGMTSMSLPTDIHVPCSIVTSGDPELTKLVAEAFNQALFTYVIPMLSPQIKNFKSMNEQLVVTRPELDLRFAQALGMSLFFMVIMTLVIYVIWELGLDSIWLPATIQRRYGIMALGCESMEEFSANLKAVLEEKSGDEDSIALCPMDENVDPMKMVELIGKLLPESKKRLVAMPSPLLTTQVAEVLRTAGKVILLVPAGAGSGKKLERVQSFFEVQGISVQGAILVQEDSKLIRDYYRIAK